MTHVHVHFFQYNIPADNELLGRTNQYINIIAEWDGKTFYGKTKRPLISTAPINLSFAECCSVKDWHAAHEHIEKLSENHFAEIFRQEKIAQARATLLSEGEPTGVPTLDRYTEKMHDLIIQETLS